MTVETILERVRWRSYWCDVGQRWREAALILLALFAVAVASSRLLALIPDVFPPTSVAIPLGLATATALVLVRRPGPAAAARRVDAALGANDLFLTWVQLSSGSGTYGPVVEERAAAAASGVRPAAVVPLRWGSGLMQVATAAGLCLVAVQFLPQLDPFGKDAERQQEAQRREKLKRSRKATTVRKAALAEASDSPEQRAAKLAMQRLQQDLRTMKPTAPQGNFRTLNDHQKALGELWRKESARTLRNALGRQNARQQFGALQSQKHQEWRRELKKSSTAGLRKELQELKEMAEQVAGKEGREREQLEREMKRRLQEMSEFLKNELGSQPVNAAMQRALEQLCQGQDGRSRKEALQAALDSMDLGEMELAAAEKAMANLENLQEALSALQMAKQLNQMKQLDGKACGDCRSMADYEQLFKKLLSEAGNGAGQQPGSGPMNGKNRGQGRGGEAPEDDDQQTDFVSERSKSALQAGKILLSWKTQEMAPTGQAVKAYRDHVDAVSQGVSEAILQEQVPPGYHDAIKQYFDTMREDTAAIPAVGAGASGD